jgi:type IV secretion system protein VirB11
MSEQTGGTYMATKILEKLARYYDHPHVEEIAINKTQEIWVKRRRGDWELSPAPEITYDYLSKICRVLANVTNARFSETDLPVVSCQVPGKPFRFQAIMGSNVGYDMGDNRGVGFAIRSLAADQSITLKEYGVGDSDAPLPGSEFFSGFTIDADHIRNIQYVIDRHLSVIVSGATSTGKTTFTNQLIRMIPDKERVITVEDARELTVPHLNRLHMTVPRNRGSNAVDYNVIINCLMRMTPDWVVCGELSVENAAPMYALMGKGHPIMTTVHSGTPTEAIRAFSNNMSLAGSTLDPESTAETLRSQIGCIIQLDRRDGRRKVVDIVFPMKEVQDAVLLRREKARRDDAKLAEELGLGKGDAAQ